MREHGTRARYVHGPDENDQPGRPCRCDDCRAANTASQAAARNRQLRRYWGAEPPALVDADPVRAHIRRLQAAGIGWKRIAAAAGVPTSTMSKLLFGDRSGPPSRRVKAATAERILAVEPDGLIADGALEGARGRPRDHPRRAAAGGRARPPAARDRTRHHPRPCGRPGRPLLNGPDMITRIRRDATRFAIWSAPRLARRTHTAALYGDYTLGRRLVDRIRPLGAVGLVPVAAVWVDAYLSEVPAPMPGDPYIADFDGPATPLERWVGDLVVARANRDDAAFVKLIEELPESLVGYHFEALLRRAATARLVLDDPDPAWP